MAPNGKPLSFVMQQQQSTLHSIHEQLTPKDTSVQVKNECILFSQSIMSGRWNPANGMQVAEMSSTNQQEGPEPRILSKKRRDLINAEIRELQNLLPLKKSARECLSYLGILALTNTFIRKATFFKKECISCDSLMTCGLVPEFSTSLCGFLLVFNREGKILYSSDNILDYLGNTVVELASQGDSIYDIVDKEDHDQIRSQLEMPPHDDRGEARELSFFCRMSTSRYMKTQMRSWKNKIVHITGRYHRPEMGNDWSDTVFFAVCAPVESKPVTDVRHHPSSRATEFKAVHGPDMMFLEVPNTVESLLGYKPTELENTSWYQWIYPEDIEQARQQHLKFVKEDGSGFACVLRMIKKDGTTVWVDISAEKSQENTGSSFICNYIIIEEEEVPYFRIHHNFLPFPEHYTDSQRQYLAYKSTLLTAALSSDVNSVSTSPMTSPTGISHFDASRFSLSQPVFSENLDTKSILRRELMKRKMSSIDSPIGVIPTHCGADMFPLPSTKVLIRSASEMHPSPSYHAPLQYSTSYPETAFPPHLLYRHPAEESFLSQLHSPTTIPTSYFYDGGYTTLAPVRPHTLTIRPSECSPVPTTETSSPINGHSIHQNQNNNTRMTLAQKENRCFPASYHGYSNQYSPAQSIGTPNYDSDYAIQVNSPCSQVSHSPKSPVKWYRHVPRVLGRIPASTHAPSDGLFHEVSEIIEGELIGEANASICGSIASSPTSLQQHTMASSYNNIHSPASYQQSPKHSPLSYIECTNVLPYDDNYGWDLSSCASDASRVSKLSKNQMEERISFHHFNESQCNSPLFGSNCRKEINLPCDSRGFVCQPTSTSFLSQEDVAHFQSKPSEIPYPVQYISSRHPNAMKQYKAAAAVFHSATAKQGRGSDIVERSPEWMKMYGNMSVTEMLFSDADGSSYLA